MALYAFDGTGNEDEVDGREDSNVVKFRDAYSEPTFYLEGIGTRFGLPGKIVGGLTGLGGRERIEEALSAFDRNVVGRDAVVDIVGFSRGAALALHFANVLFEKRDGAAVRFLGLWDAVASFGLPGNDTNLGWTFTLPDNVVRCRHAMALDERRRGFPLTRVRTAGGEAAGVPRLTEVWFRGVHSDVGGGNGNLALSSSPLAWMLRRAHAAGLPIRHTSVIDAEKRCQPDAPISKNRGPHTDLFRPIATGDRVHESVRSRGQQNGVAHNDPPAGIFVARG